MAPSMEATREDSLDIPHEIEAPLPPSGKGAAPINPEAVNHVMYSDIGINVLLNRLKQSISSAKDFSGFLSKRARIEDEHVQAMRKLSRATADSVRQQDSRQGSYALQVNEVCRAHERMADHGAQFASSLQMMHQDIDELAANMERQRKRWKSEGLNNEKKVKDAESALDKAKSKYDSTAESYERARTGGGDSGRVFTVKGPKSAEKHEADLLSKLQGADSDYASKVQLAQVARQENAQSLRPQAVKALQELIRECDSALTLQLQKFAAFNEKFIVGCGLEISPMRNSEGERTGPLSMREMITEIDNERDFHGYVSSHAKSVPPMPAEIRYIKHPILGPTQQAPSQPMAQPAATPMGSANNRASMQPGPPPQSAPGPQTQPPSSFGVMQPGPGPSNNEVPASQQAGQYRNAYHASQAMPPSTPQGPAQARQATASPDRQYYPSSGPAAPVPDYNYNSGSPQTHIPPQQPPQQQRIPQQLQPQSAPQLPPIGGPVGFSPTSASPSAANGAPRYGSQGGQGGQGPAPTKPVFGQTLNQLFVRDDLAVPLVVLQCIQAVELFGLDTEGIYRLNGNSRHVDQMKALFDSNAPKPDFRNPAAFHHDVNSAASLLKQFFRELPDPLFTTANYSAFIDAAKIEDENVRRDSIHAIINELPDPNYATMRAVVLHLHRVMEHSEVNRMSAHNLAICFAPALMGQHTGPQIADAGLQARVLDTILKNVYQIFDED